MKSIAIGKSGLTRSAATICGNKDPKVQASRFRQYLAATDQLTRLARERFGKRSWKPSPSINNAAMPHSRNNNEKTTLHRICSSSHRTHGSCLRSTARRRRASCRMNSFSSKEDIQ